MDWTKIIAELQAGGYTLEKIAAESGMASKGHVHDLKMKKQATCTYEVGAKLVEMHRRRRKK